MRSLEKSMGSKRKKNVRGRKSEVAESMSPRGNDVIFETKHEEIQGRFKRGRKPQCCAHLLTHTRTLHFRRHVSQKRALYRGAGDLVRISPLPLLFRFMLYSARNRAEILPLPERSPRRPEVAVDFPCLRQLPPPPELQCGHERRRRDRGRRERRGRHMCADDAHAEYPHMGMSADDAGHRRCANNAHARG